MMKRILTLSVLLIAVCSFGQDRETKEQRKERIKAHKIAFISSELDLTPEEAEVFWPVYNEMDAKLEEIHEQRRKIGRKLKNHEELTDDEMYDLTLEMLDLEDQENEIKKEYLSKFADAIGKKKAAKVFMAEERFKRELLKKLKNKDGHGPGGGPGHGGPGHNNGPGNR